MLYSIKIFFTRIPNLVRKLPSTPRIKFVRVWLHQGKSSYKVEGEDEPKCEKSIKEDTNNSPLDRRSSW